MYLALPAMTVGGTYFVLHMLLAAPADANDSTPILFEVQDQESFREIASDLTKRGLIRHPKIFKLIATLKGQDRGILAGEYELSPSMPPAEILAKMVSGKMFLRRITVKEGTSMWEIGALVQDAGLVERGEFEAALTDPVTLKQLGVDANSFEGYLFPETYQFPRGTKVRKILTTMVEQLDKIWEPEWNDRLRALGMTKHQILTLASIIEKETGNVEEQPLISSVFHNRLKKRMRLQADPTVIYGIPNFNGNLTKQDLLLPTPYNTYAIEGLPPGPIANPGRSAISAALNPATTEYLYFVADGTGKHVFSASLDDHNQAVNSYQRNPSKTPSNPESTPQPK